MGQEIQVKTSDSGSTACLKRTGYSVELARVQHRYRAKCSVPALELLLASKDERLGGKRSNV